MYVYKVISNRVVISLSVEILDKVRRIVYREIYRQHSRYFSICAYFVRQKQEEDKQAGRQTRQDIQTEQTVLTG